MELNKDILYQNFFNNYKKCYSEKKKANQCQKEVNEKWAAWKKEYKEPSEFSNIVKVEIEDLQRKITKKKVSFFNLLTNKVRQTFNRY